MKQEIILKYNGFKIQIKDEKYQVLDQSFEYLQEAKEYINQNQDNQLMKEINNNPQFIFSKVG